SHQVHQWRMNQSPLPNHFYKTELYTNSRTNSNKREYHGSIKINYTFLCNNVFLCFVNTQLCLLHHRYWNTTITLVFNQSKYATTQTTSHNSNLPVLFL